ncbi:DUF115 domain-containing protein, partial [bacterium]|nr:DUF115 domain-containing protein [bacterium]MBU1024470.1 DUF115 domain-containing protein [bacterium]
MPQSLTDTMNLTKDNSDIFQMNMSVITRRDSDLAQRLLIQNTEDSLTCELTKSKDGSANMLVRKNGSEIHLHSRFNPIKEAEQLVKGVFEEQRNYYIVYGMGLGYPLEELFRKTLNTDLIFLMEPNIELFRKTLEQRDLTEILSKGNLHWSIGESPENAFGRWARTYNISQMDGLGFLELPSIKNISEPDYLKKFNNKLKGLLVTAGGNLQTLMLMARQYQANTLHNVRYILKNPPLMSLFEKFKDKPAIIVSAGPSLDKNIDLLHEACEKALIIAVDTSLKPLHAQGIVPHLICTGDPQEANYRHIQNSSDGDSFLVAEPMTNIKSFRDFDGKLFVTSYGDKLVKWIESFIPELGQVMCWGSVATMAFDLARKLSANPIIFVGQDLSFPQGRTYARGTYFETEEKRIMTVKEQEKNGVYQVDDIFGNEISTNRQMFAYHRWFVGEIARTESRVINATEGGILKEGVEIMTLRQALDEYCTIPFNAFDIIKKTADEYQGMDARQLKTGLEGMLKDLKKMRDISKECFDSAKEWLTGSMNFTVLPKDIAIENMNVLEESRKFLIEKTDAFKILEMADQSAIKRFLKGYRIINGRQIGLTSYRQVLEIY